MRNRTLLSKKLVSSKLSLLATSIIAALLDVILLLTMAIYGFEFYYIKCTFVLALFNIIFAVVVWYSNFRFKYTIPYIVIYIIVVVITIISQNNIYFPSDSIEIATNTISTFWLISHASVVLSVIVATIGSRNTFKPSSIIISSIHIAIIAVISFIQLVLVFTNGVFGHGANAKTIVYTTRDNGTLKVSDVLIDNNDTVIIPYEYNGRKVTSFDTQLFTRDDIKHYIFNTKDTKLIFENPHFSLDYNTDITGEANLSTLDYLKETFYKYDNLLNLANSLVPNDLSSDKVYVNFTYDQKSLELYANPLKTWIGQKGEEFNFDEYKDEYIFFNRFDQSSTEDLLWSLENSEGYILNTSVISDVKIEKSVNNSLILDKIFEVSIRNDNDDAYEIADEYKYSYTSNGIKQNYLYLTRSTIESKFNAIPRRDGFDLSLYYLNNLVNERNEMLNLLSLMQGNKFEINPIWSFKPIDDLKVESSASKIEYGESITLTAEHMMLGEGFNYSYRWTNSSNEVVGYDKTFTTKTLTPSPDGDVYFVELIVTHQNSSLTKILNAETSIIVEKKAITPIWDVEEHVYDGTEKTISVEFAIDDIVEGDDAFDFNLIGDKKYLNFATKIDAGEYQFTIELGDSLINKYEISDELKTNKLIINKRVITPVWDTNEFVYNGSHQRPLLVDVENALEIDKDTILASVTYTGTAVSRGTHYITASLSSPNYEFSSDAKNYKYNIEAKPITAVWEKTDGYNDITYVYDGMDHAPRIVELIGCVYSNYNDVLEKIQYTGTGKNYSEDAYTCTAKLPDDSNYVISNESKICNFYIDKRNIDTINWTNQTFTYDGTNQASKVTATYKNLYNKDVMLNVTFDRSFIEAGVYVATSTITDSNYRLVGNVSKEIVMEKAINTIVKDFDIKGWNVGEEPKAATQPQSKFGTPTVTYYSDEDLTVVVEKFTSSTPAGTYYAVVATPDGQSYTSVVKIYSFTIGEGIE